MLGSLSTILLCCRSLCRGRRTHGYYVCPFCFCVVFLCAVTAQSAFRSSLGGIALDVGIDSMCLWEAMSSGSSFGCVLLCLLA